MQHKLLHILLYIGILLSVTACEDRLEFNNLVIGEGESVISATVEFKPMVTTLGSRADGGAIRNINNITVVIYEPSKEEGVEPKLLQICRFNEGEFHLDDPEPDRTNLDSDIKDVSESTTARATLTLPPIAYGKYQMYVVANMKVTDEMADTPAKLKNTLAEWNNDLSENAEMFGYLTDKYNPEVSQNLVKEDFNAPTIAINQPAVQLHSWIKRLASKLTLVFDGSGLHEGIFVYIHKATIHDIPRYCHLGEENRPFWDKDNGYKTGNTKGVAPKDNIEGWNEWMIDDGESLYYSAKGVVSPSGDDVDPANLTFQYAQANWLEIDKATKSAGAVIDGKEHPETAQALYFYENCQGDYKDKAQFDKRQQWDGVGEILHPGDDDWKDEVPCGTYVEVEGYYSANYNGYLSSGPIKYRFMLGQDEKYNYNALRNRHYKLYLGFRGYANQPDWHIEYEDQDPGLYPPTEYYMSYLYNVRQEMPIRLTGPATKVTMEIVENSWAPYDPTQPDELAKDSIGNPDTYGLPFTWYKSLYLNEVKALGKGKAMYGVHSISSKDSAPYGYDILNDPDPQNVAPKWVNRSISPIWVGFLALQAPSGYEDATVTKLPTGIYDDGGDNGDFYNKDKTIKGIQNYYYGAETEGENGRATPNKIPLYKNTYNISGNVNFDDQTPIEKVYDFPSGEDNNKVGRNGFTAKKFADQSISINVPMFTLPKDIGYITGFSGNNPYEAYERRAMVKITAYFDSKDKPKIVKYVPIYQVKRLINPKAVWRSSDESGSFKVTLMELESAGSSQFKPVESRKEWEAYVADPTDESKPLTSGPFTLSGAVDGKVTGFTGSNIEFTINFGNESKCGKIIVRYHGNLCEHHILVRKGYDTPLKVGNAVWSSYSVYNFNESAPKPEYDKAKKQWTFPGRNIEDLEAKLTVSPLALGTMFKRGNYKQGIRIINNWNYGPLEKPGELTLTWGENEWWNNIYGIPAVGYGWSPQQKYGSGGYWNDNDINVTHDWEWSPFQTEGNDLVYDVPTLDNFKSLMKEGFGIGVMYADGAYQTANNTTDAFQFFSADNVDTSSSKGMRGFIVYNLSDYNQVFFPIGFSGVGRRTIANEAQSSMYGVLRYGNQSQVLSVELNENNQFRPISYSNPYNPGAMYWAKAHDGDAHYSMSMNFFDINFGPGDYAANWPDFGDAMPIKPIVVDRSNNPTSRRR